jgi:hypothetical protein
VLGNVTGYFGHISGDDQKLFILKNDINEQLYRFE